jgi:hypothetical protein
MLVRFGFLAESAVGGLVFNRLDGLQDFMDDLAGGMKVLDE